MKAATMRSAHPTMIDGNAGIPDVGGEGKGEGEGEGEGEEEAEEGGGVSTPALGAKARCLPQRCRESN